MERSSEGKYNPDFNPEEGYLKAVGEVTDNKRFDTSKPTDKQKVKPIEIEKGEFNPFEVKAPAPITTALERKRALLLQNFRDHTLVKERGMESTLKVLPKLAETIEQLNDDVLKSAPYEQLEMMKKKFTQANQNVKALISRFTNLIPAEIQSRLNTEQELRELDAQEETTTIQPRLSADRVAHYIENLDNIVLGAKPEKEILTNENTEQLHETLGLLKDTQKNLDKLLSILSERIVTAGREMRLRQEKEHSEKNGTDLATHFAEVRELIHHYPLTELKKQNDTQLNLIKAEVIRNYDTITTLLAKAEVQLRYNLPGKIKDVADQSVITESLAHTNQTRIDELSKHLFSSIYNLEHKILEPNPTRGLLLLTELKELQLAAQEIHQYLETVKATIDKKV